MQLYLGSDHAGFELKNELSEHLKGKGFEVVDLGAFDGTTKVDYPDVAREVSEKVLENEKSVGVLVCGTGMGVAIAANKLKGIRAVTIHDVNTAKLAKEHNDANVIALGGRILEPQVAKDMVDAFLMATFEGGRHADRIKKISALEND